MLFAEAKEEQDGEVKCLVVLSISSTKFTRRDTVVITIKR